MPKIKQGLISLMIVCIPWPLTSWSNGIKGEVDALYRPVDGRLLKLQTLLPPKRDNTGAANTSRRRGCPDKVIIGGAESSNGRTPHNFSTTIVINKPIVIRCR